MTALGPTPAYYDHPDLDVGEDTLGMKVSSGSVVIEKDAKNLIGISIGGGAPYCPCLYVVQVFDHTPAAEEGTLASGDELVGVNGRNIKASTKVEVARLIQNIKGPVTITYNKLHADPKQGRSLDIVMKKAKHKVVESMSSSTADALGLSRAILTNDALVKKHNELQRISNTYKGLMEHTRSLLQAFFKLSRVQKAFGDVFAEIGVRDPQPNASEAFSTFGNGHRSMEKMAMACLKQIKPMIQDLNTYLTKAVPDTKLTIKKYLDAKFEYLSYCLKVKELDDEEYSYAAIHEPLYRVETGNYEYRLVLRCRQEARRRFAKLRSDVLVKIELLDQKHVQDTVHQLQRFVKAMSTYHQGCHDAIKDCSVFPIEVDLSATTFSYNATGQINDGLSDDEEDIEQKGAAGASGGGSAEGSVGKGEEGSIGGGEEELVGSRSEIERALVSAELDVPAAVISVCPQSGEHAATTESADELLINLS